MRFEHLLRKAQTPLGLRGFSRGELYELGRLYRKVAADLAKAQTIGADGDILAYLNGLLALGHNVVYRGESQPLRSVITFITTGFPRLFRRHIGVIFIAIIVFFLPAIWAFMAYTTNPTWAEVALPGNIREFYETELEGGPSQLAVAIRDGEMAAASTFIILNNINVSIYAFAGGILLGIGTLFTLLQNGLFLGAIAAIFVSKGSEFSLYFFSGVLPHGVLELPAICIAGGAGLLLGKAIIAPGQLRRMDALKQNGKEAAMLLMGVAIILVVAGLIEGFITPIKINGEGDVPVLMYFKLSFAVMVFLLFIAYLVLPGRRPGEKPLDFVNEKIENIDNYTPRGIYRVLTSETQEF